MNDLIGYRCRIVFDLEPTDWPISGYPAWAVCHDVAMPMIKLKGSWFNASIIKTISASGPPVGGTYMYGEPNWENAPHCREDVCEEVDA